MKIKDNKGITLVSLIITIIVMTVLVSTVLVISLGDDGLVKNAKEAKEKVEDSSVYQSVAEAIITSKKKNGKINEESFKNKLQVIDENSNLTYNDANKTYTATVKNIVYIIEEYGNITVQE